MDLAFERAHDAKQSAVEQRRWMALFLRMVNSPLGRPSVFADLLEE